MEIKLDAKLVVFLILASLVLELLVLDQLVLQTYLETLFLVMVNNAITVIKLDVIKVKLFLAMFVQDLQGQFQFVQKNVEMELRLSTSNVIMVARRDAQFARYKLVSLAFITYTLSHFATKTVGMELELRAKNVIIEIKQVARLIVKQHQVPHALEASEQFRIVV